MPLRHCEVVIVERKGPVGAFLSGVKVTLSFILFFITSLSSFYFQMIWIPLLYIYQPLHRRLCELFIGLWLEFSTVSDIISVLRSLSYSIILYSSMLACCYKEYTM